jgi:hypothetical protein
MVRPRKAGLFQTDFCLARGVRTGQERVSGDAAFALRLRFPRLRSLRLRSGQALRQTQGKQDRPLEYSRDKQDNFRDAEIAVSAVFSFHFWGRKSPPEKFSAAKTVKTAETLDGAGPNGVWATLEGLVGKRQAGGEWEDEKRNLRVPARPAGRRAQKVRWGW